MRLETTRRFGRALGPVLRRALGSERYATFTETMLELSLATKRIAQEYREIHLAQSKGLVEFACLIYVHPLQVRDRERLSAAFAKAAGSPLGEDGLPAAVPFLSGAFYCQVRTASAEHAAAMLLTLVRDAFAECDLTMDRVRVEARPMSEAGT